MALAAYGAHVCPNDGVSLRPCSYTHDVYECPRCKEQFATESLTPFGKPGDKTKHFNG